MITIFIEKLMPSGDWFLSHRDEKGDRISGRYCYYGRGEAIRRYIDTHFPPEFEEGVDYEIINY